MFAIFKQNQIDINTHAQHIYDYWESDFLQIGLIFLDQSYSTWSDWNSIFIKIKSISSYYIYCKSQTINRSDIFDSLINVEDENDCHFVMSLIWRNLSYINADI